MPVCSNYAKNYASIIYKGLIQTATCSPRVGRVFSLYDFWKASIYYCPYSLAEGNTGEYVCTLTPRIWWSLGLLCLYCIPALSLVHFYFSINLRGHTCTMWLKDPWTALWFIEFCPLAELNNTSFPLHSLILSRNVYLGWQCERPYFYKQTVSLT